MIEALVLAVTAWAAPCPPACERADSLVEAGDTAAAVQLLRGLAEATSPDAGVLGRLGRLLVETAPSRATDFEQRAEAERLLQQAIDLDGGDPRWWLARGLLERKRQNQVDAGRLLGRAADLAAELDQGGEGGEGLSARELARLHAEVGRALEEHVMDFRGFIPQHPDLPVVTGGVGAGGEVCPVAFCRNFERPRSFHEILLKYETQDDLVDDDRTAMRRHFGLAFQLDPSLSLAARGWLGALAWSEEWEAYVEVARRHLEAVGEGESGWPLAFLAAGRWRMGDEAGADSAFQAALARLPTEEVRLLRDVERLLRKEAAERQRERSDDEQEGFRSVLWQTLDPLLLTETNERQLEHFTRVALAELRFGEPNHGLRGVETDRGLIYVRYGEPRWIRQVRVESGDLQALSVATGGSGAARSAAGGRWVFWTYSRDVPSFIFQKALGARRVAFPISTATKEFEEAARARRPSSFTIPNFDRLAHQVTRFKGDSVDVDADVVVALPRVGEGRSQVPAEAGFFVLPRGPEEEVARMETSVDLALEGGRSITFRVPVNRGEYPYAVEVVSRDRSVLAATRGSLDARPFSGELALSDILMARRIEPAVPEPGDRRDFHIVPAADLTFVAGDPIAVYFEIYGLRTLGEAVPGRYSVELRVRGEDEDLFGGIVRRLSDILGRSPSGTVTWEGSARASQDRVPEWFTLSLPDLEPGEYQVQVVVRDGISGQEAGASRTVTLVDEPTADGSPPGRL